MARLASNIVAILSAGIIGMSCNAGIDDRGFKVPYTELYSVELLFSEDLPEHYFKPENEKYLVCRDSEVPNDGKRNLVNTVLNTDHMYLGNDEECSIHYKRVMDPNVEYDIEVAKNGCSLYFALAPQKIDHIYVVGNHDKVDQFNKCKYRVGLFALGYNGALDITDERLFVPKTNSFWASFSDGPKYVPLFQYFMDLCDLEMRRFKSQQNAINASQNIKCGTIKGWGDGQ